MNVFTGLRFPAQELVRADAKVPSLLYYVKSGNFRATGALIEKSTLAEWLVIDNDCTGLVTSDSPRHLRR